VATHIFFSNIFFSLSLFSSLLSRSILFSCRCRIMSGPACAAYPCGHLTALVVGDEGEGVLANGEGEDELVVVHRHCLAEGNIASIFTDKGHIAGVQASWQLLPILGYLNLKSLVQAGSPSE
jgi:hypothetical protein